MIASQRLKLSAVSLLLAGSSVPYPIPIQRGKQGGFGVSQTPYFPSQGGHTYPWLLLYSRERSCSKVQPWVPASYCWKLCSCGPSRSRSPGVVLTSCLQQTGTAGSLYVSR